MVPDSSSKVSDDETIQWPRSIATRWRELGVRPTTKKSAVSSIAAVKKPKRHLFVLGPVGVTDCNHAPDLRERQRNVAPEPHSERPPARRKLYISRGCHRARLQVKRREKLRQFRPPIPRGQLMT